MYLSQLNELIKPIKVIKLIKWESINKLVFACFSWVFAWIFACLRMNFGVFSIGFRVFSPPSRTPVHQIFSTKNGPPQILKRG